MLIILALERMRQEDSYDLVVSLGYTIRTSFKNKTKQKDKEKNKTGFL